MGQPKKSSNAWLWWLLGALAAIGIIIGILFATGVFGGGKYAGDKVPELPEKFGEWTRDSGSDGIQMGGDSYKKGSDVVLVGRYKGDPDKEIDTSKQQAEKQGVKDYKERNVGKGITCFDGEIQNQELGMCVIAYKDGLVTIATQKPSVAEDAAKAFVDNVK